MNSSIRVDDSRFATHGSGPQRPRHVGYDLSALAEFAYQLLCQAATPKASPECLPWPAFGDRHSGQARVERLRASAINPARLNTHEVQGTKHKAHSPIPLAYEIWLSYLFELEALLHYAQLAARELTALELQGLQAISRARSRFLRTHQFCPHCDTANPRATQRCAHCQKEL